MSKKEVTHDWFVMTPDGKTHDYHQYLDNTPFGCLVKKELGVAEPTGGEPAHVDLMRSKELVDYEPASDVGCLRWLPKGKLVRDLLADYVLALVLPYGATPVETPVMYDLGDKAICEHAAKFGERQYRFKSNNRDMMLRFAACFGMFSIMRDMHISKNTLPMKMYELSTYSFRHEQKGEVIGLKRLRCFTMPDMHSLCTDMPEAMKCFEEQLAIGWKTGRDFETKLVAAFRCTKKFYDENEAWVKKIVKESDCPMLIEILSERVHYWEAKIDLAAIDGQNRPIENPTVQIDVESSTRFNIKYFKDDGTPVHPPILHCSPTGSVERVICAILENISTQKVPALPTWLSPTQVRVVPVAERHTAYAQEVCDTFNKQSIRCDIDDREESVGKKVREAGMDWVPYVIVIGDEEMANKKLTVTIRRKSEPNKPYKEQMTADALAAAVKKEIAESRSARSIPRASSRLKRGISETFFFSYWNVCSEATDCFERMRGSGSCKTEGCVALPAIIRKYGGISIMENRFSLFRILLVKNEAVATPPARILHFPGGITISNREPAPGTPVSFMEMPVMARMSRTRNRPRPDDFEEPDDVVNPRSKINSFLSCGIPTPSSS